MTAGTLHDDEAYERDDPADSGREHPGRGPAVNGPGGEREDDPTQTEGGEAGPEVVETARPARLPALGHGPQGGPCRHRREGQVDEADHPPADDGRQIS